jgi:glyoxylase-like metal-dependent hydrolase (beta-lactamase superfamily II)
MHNFIRIQGSTYYLPLEHSNVGLYVHKKSGVLIDSGYTEADARLILDLLESKGIRLEMILNTHAHPDNCGGTGYLKKWTDCKVLISQGQRLILENPARSNYIPTLRSRNEGEEGLETEAVPTSLSEVTDEDTDEILEGDASTPDTSTTEDEDLEDTLDLPEEAKIKRAVIRPKPCRPTALLKGQRPVKTASGKSLDIVDLSGHVQGQMGVVTPDQVFFIADALYTIDELSETPIPYLESVESYKSTLEYLLNTSYSNFVPTHGTPFEFSITTEVLYHQRQIEMLEEAIRLHLQMPRTREELVALLFATFNIEQTIQNFYRMTATIVSLLNSLKRQQLITIIHERGKTRWFAKK